MFYYQFRASSISSKTWKFYCAHLSALLSLSLTRYHITHCTAIILYIILHTSLITLLYHTSDSHPWSWSCIVILYFNPWSSSLIPILHPKLWSQTVIMILGLDIFKNSLHPDPRSQPLIPIFDLNPWLIFCVKISSIHQFAILVIRLSTLVSFYL